MWNRITTSYHSWKKNPNVSGKNCQNEFVKLPSSALVLKTTIFWIVRKMPSWRFRRWYALLISCNLRMECLSLKIAASRRLRSCFSTAHIRNLIIALFMEVEHVLCFLHFFQKNSLWIYARNKSKSLIAFQIGFSNQYKLYSFLWAKFKRVAKRTIYCGEAK